jgi:transposase
VAKDTHLKCFILSGGQEHDAPAGRLVLETADKQERTVSLLMDRAYADFKTRFTAWDLRFQAVVPPKSNTVDKWEYDKELYKRRNEIERFFRRLKTFRAVFTRYDKLDIVFFRLCSFRLYHYTFALCEHALEIMDNIVDVIWMKC